MRKQKNATATETKHAWLMENAAKKKKTSKKSAPADSESDTSGILDTSIKTETDFEEVNINLPPKEDLSVLLNRIEMQLPKDDHVKYDSR